MAIPFAEILAKTNYSFLEGASHPEEMVLRAKELGYSSIGIVDNNGVYGIPRAHVAAKKSGIPLLVGATLALPSLTIHLLAKNRIGYGNLCEILTEAHSHRPHGDRDYPIHISPELLLEKQDGLYLLISDVKADSLIPQLWNETFKSRIYLSVSIFLDGKDEKRLEEVEFISRKWHLPCFASNVPLFHVRERKSLQDVLTCIRHNTSLAKAGFKLLPNDERHLKPIPSLEKIFKNHPEWLEATCHIAEQCHFSLDEIHYQYPTEWIPQGETGNSYLEKLVWQEAQARFDNNPPPKMLAQLRKELNLIRELNYSDYFLTIWDIVQFAKKKQILYQGRGSAANSCVCFILGITALDPIRMDLLFERFISRERQEPPDIDIDFEHERREEVIQYIYQRYGRHRAAITAEVICYRRKSVLREVAKVFDLPEKEMVRWQTFTHRTSLKDVSEAALFDIFPDQDPEYLKKYFSLSRELLGFPRHLGTHVGGFVLCQEALSRNVPIEKAAMQDRTIIQWDKNDLDALGFVRVDILGLGILTCLRKCFSLIQIHEQKNITLANIPPDDPAVFDAMCKADTVGVFQIESRAQMNMLPRLRPRNFFDIVVEISLVRPGPIQGEMVHPYLRRRFGEEKIEYAHPDLKPILGKTYGVPLFQEQIMKMAMAVAGFSAGEADELRRAMGSWRKTQLMGQIGERFQQGLIAHGVSKEFAARIFSQIEGFAEYGFPESHAASFALLAYATAWLKFHYPLHYLTAILNSQPMGFYSPRTLIHDGERHHVTCLPIDVNRSEWDHRIESNKMRVGFRVIRGLSSRTAQKIVEARDSHPFQNWDDFLFRLKENHPFLSKRDLFLLAGANAFDILKMPRRQALWEIQALQLPDAYDFSAREESSFPLPKEEGWERIQLDYEAQGLSFFSHPMAFLRAELAKKGIIDSSKVSTHKRIKTAGIVVSRQMPPTKGNVLFITLEDEFGFINLVIWNSIFKKYKEVLLTQSFLFCEGKIEKSAHGQVTHVIMSHAEPLLAHPTTSVLSDLNEVS